MHGIDRVYFFAIIPRNLPLVQSFSHISTRRLLVIDNYCTRIPKPQSAVIILMVHAFSHDFKLTRSSWLTEHHQMTIPIVCYNQQQPLSGRYIDYYNVIYVPTPHCCDIRMETAIIIQIQILT